MTSREALKNICIDCEKSMAKSFVRCPFRSISNEYCDKYMKIEKDLEVLEILKDSYKANKTKTSILIGAIKDERFIEMFLGVRGTDKVNKVKEWLDDNRKVS